MKNKLLDWDNFFNFDFLNLIIINRFYPYILLLQFLWLILIFIFIYKKKKTIFILLNIVSFQFICSILLYLHYLNKLRTSLFEYKVSILFTFDQMLLIDSRWLTFFSYEIIIATIMFILSLIFLSKKRL